MRSLFLLTALFPLMVTANDAQKDYIKKKDALEKRYQDYLIHKQNLIRYDVERRSDANEMKVAREKRKQELETYRKNFVKNRKAKFDLEVYYPEYEKIVAEREKLRKKQRDIFVANRNKLRQFLEGAKYIPDDEVVGLK